MVTAGRTALATVDLQVAQGADNIYRFRYSTGTPATPVDLTGWTARAQIRHYVGGPVWLTLTNTAGITLAADGTITVTVPHATTEATDWNLYTTGVWDLELTDGAGTRTRLLAGAVTVSHDVTRDA